MIDEEGTSPAENDRAALLARRDAVDAELKRLAKVDAQRAAAESALAALDTEQHEIDHADQEAWRQWASDPQGESPSPRAAEREDLARRRGAAANAFASASNAQRAVDARRAELSAELRTIGRAFVRLAIGDALETARKLAAEQTELGTRLTDATHERFGLIAAIRREAGTAISRDDRALADELTRAAD
jgi:hypothetical protein